MTVCVHQGKLEFIEAIVGFVMRIEGPAWGQFDQAANMLMFGADELAKQPGLPGD